MVLHGSQYDEPDEELAPVPSSGNKLTAKVTQTESVA
jgi:hypothetical protein